ncbi:hypothetical protein AB4536_17010 [Vibrio cyclitrophicus]
MLSALVVLYRKNITTSNTLSSLLASNVSSLLDNILVWDNSPESLPTKDIDSYIDLMKGKSIKVSYHHELSNSPLSIVYNKFISQFNDSKFLMILDDDTLLNEDFFYELDKHISDYDSSDLYLPRIYHKDKMISPSKRFFMKGWYLDYKPKGKFNSKFLSAINSCMVISVDFLRKTNFQYDERLISYGTDDQFILNFTRNNGICHILDVDIKHDLTLSTMNGDSFNFRAKYFMMIESWFVIYSSNIFSQFLVFFYALVHVSFTSFRFRNSEYLKDFFKMVSRCQK